MPWPLCRYAGCIAWRTVTHAEGLMPKSLNCSILPCAPIRLHQINTVLLLQILGLHCMARVYAFSGEPQSGSCLQESIPGHGRYPLHCFQYRLFPISTVVLYPLQNHLTLLCCYRYSGYIAWRGVMRAQENPEVAAAVRKAYPGMGHTLYFDIASGTHSVLYELPEERLNWLW